MVADSQQCKRLRIIPREDDAVAVIHGTAKESLHRTCELVGLQLLVTRILSQKVDASFYFLLQRRFQLLPEAHEFGCKEYLGHGHSFVARSRKLPFRRGS